MTSKKKNIISRPEIEQLCRSEKDLASHIKKVLSEHKPRSFEFDTKKSVPAAVLIPIYFKDDQAYLLFTKRSNFVEHHKGQVSFPGGRKDKEDENLEITALRETEEEVGICRSDIRLAGRTDRFLTNTYFMVTPFTGFFDYPYNFTVSEAEIERLIEVPLIHLLEDKHFEVKPFKKDGHTWMVHYYRYGTDVIWGVTGFLLSNFLSIVFGCDRNIFSQLK